MKKNKLYFGMIAALVFTGIFSCKRDMALKDPANPASSNSAFISLIDVSPNLDTVLGAKADTFNVLFNGVKVTGYTAGTSPVMSFGGIYPLAGNNVGYAAIPAGSQSIEFANGVNSLDSTVLATFQKTFQPNTYYSFIITDSVKSLRDSSRMLIKDSLIAVPPGFYNLRFVNAVLNDTAGVDVWSSRNNRNIFTNIKPGNIAGFSSFGGNFQLADTFFCRRAGTQVGLDTLLTQYMYNLRTYTLIYKGNAFSTVKTDAKRRHLIVYINQ